MYPCLQSARSAEIGLKIVQRLQQHDDVLAACGEVCRTGRTFGSELQELSEQVKIPAVGEDLRRCRQRAQQPPQDRLGQESVPKHPD